MLPRQHRSTKPNQAKELSPWESASPILSGSGVNRSDHQRAQARSGIVRDRRQCVPGPFHPRAAFRLQRLHAARPPARQEIHAAGDRPLRREAACRRSRYGARLDREDGRGVDPKNSVQLQRIESIKLRSKTFRAAFDAYWRTTHRRPSHRRQGAADIRRVPAAGARRSAHRRTGRGRHHRPDGQDRRGRFRSGAGGIRHPQKAAAPRPARRPGAGDGARRLCAGRARAGLCGRLRRLRHLDLAAGAHQKGKEVQRRSRRPRARLHRGMGDRNVLARLAPHAQTAKAILATADADRRAANRAARSKLGRVRSWRARRGSGRCGKFRKRA